MCLCIVLVLFVFICDCRAEYSWKFEKVEREVFGKIVEYDVEYSRVGGRTSGGENYQEPELQLIMKHFGVTRPQDLIGKVFTTDSPGMFLYGLTESVRKERDEVIQKGWQDKYKKAGFSDSAPILNCDFSSPLIADIMGTGRESIFEKAIWNGNQLEVNILMSVNCAVTDIKGVARLNGDRVELTVEPHFPSDGSMALCESVHRYIFKIRDLENKDYRIGFRCGLFTQEVLLKKDAPIITEPLEVTLKKGAEKAHENRKIELDQKINEYTKAIEKDPNSVKSYYWRGTTYGKKGSYEQAIADYSKALEINSNSV